MGDTKSDTHPELLKFRKLVFFCGPTASGKTGLAHALADKLFERRRNKSIQVVIVNMDAFQFYRGFDRGTAKASRSELLKYNYKLVDFLDPSENIDANVFAQKARESIEESLAAGAYVFVVGGSGLYLRTLLHGLDDLPSRHPEIREFIRMCAATQGNKSVHGWLKALDEHRASQLHVNDLVRVERALEIFLLTGQKPSELSSLAQKPARQARILDAFVVNIRVESLELDKRISARTQLLLQSGWLEEVRLLCEKYGSAFDQLPASRAIGYCEVARFIAQENGTESSSQNIAELESKISILTRQYAKRQQTWMNTASIDLLIQSDGERELFIECYMRFAKDRGDLL